MYLSRLVIQGFKSFASGTQLDFRAGITAIVGPNGSGKSNVAESIRWALGEQSLKALRGKKGEDVIFAGSDKKARLGVAEVALHLNNEDQRAAVPYSELVLTRRVYRDGEGEYLINHQAARLQDFQLLLAQANFGQRTYSVIGQGMIDSFLLSGPQERKHLFDEAAGVRQYQLKKDQAVHKLDQAKDNLTQGEALMAEIEPRLRSLTRQVRRLEKREEVEKELRQKQRVYFGLQWRELRDELGQLEREHRASEQQRRSIEHELQVTQTELEQIERERTGSEVFAELQKKYNRVLDQKNSRLQEQSIIKGRLEVAMREAGRGEAVYHQHRVQDVKRHLDRIQEELQVVEQMEQRTGATVDREEKAKSKWDAEFGSLEKQLTVSGQQTLSGGLSEVRHRLTGWQHRLAEWRKQLDRDTPDLPSLRQAASRLADDLQAVMADVDHVAKPGVTDVVQLQQRALEIMHRRQSAVERLAAVRHDHQRATDQRQRLTDERQQLAAELDQLQRESSIQELAKTDPERAYAAYAQQAKDIESRLADLDAELKQAREAINNFNQLETTKKERLFTLQKAFRDTQAELNQATARTNDQRVAMAKLEQRLEDLQREISQAMGQDGIQTVELAIDQSLRGDVTLLAEEISHLHRQMDLIGGIDEQITHEYRETNERWEFLNGQAEDLHTAIDSLERAIGELEVTIKKRFDAAFKKINQEFHQYFRTLFSGGKAELVLIQEVVQPESTGETEDDEKQEPELIQTPSGPKEILITGIEIKATPPGKKLSSIAMLSGGERALTSIALLCAIISNNPSPFVVLDEVDAALDEANSQRFSAILDHLAKNTQFIVITHNRATMEKAQVLYGVTMGDDGISQLLSVKMEEAEEIIRRHGNR